MASSIKGTIGIDGASKFKSDLSAAKQSVKELNSELKLAESQFEQTGDKEQLAADKSKILKEQIDAQESVIKLLNEQLKTASEKYGNNSTKVSKLKEELNKAKISQNNMKSALNDAEKPLEDAAEDAKTLADKMSGAATNTGTLDEKLQNVSTHLDLQAVQTFADNVSSALETAAKKAADLAVKVWNIGTEAGSTADNWLTMSDQFGVPVEDLQKWDYAGRFIDTTLENITGSYEKFHKKYSGQNRTITFNNFVGKPKINVKDAEGDLRSAMDVYWDLIEVIGNEYNNGSQEKAEQAALEWFGRSAANMNPLFKAGKDAFMALGEEAQNMGYIMSEEDVSALGEFDNKTQQLEASLQALEQSFALELLPLLQPIADGFKQISDTMIEWLQSEEGKKAISDLSTAIGGVFDAMSGDIPDAVSKATELVTNFANGFGSAEEAVNKVITAVETLAAIWAASKLASFGASMVGASQAIGSFFGKLLAGVTGGGGATATAAGAGGATATATGAGAGFWSTLLGGAGAKIAGGATAFIGTLFGNMIKQDAQVAGEKTQASQDIAGLDQGTRNQIIMHAKESGQTLQEAEEIMVDTMREWRVSADEAAKLYVFGGDPATPINGEAPTSTSKDNAETTKTLAYETEVYADALKRLDAAMQDLEEGNGDDWLRNSVEELQSADVENIFTPDVIEGLFNYDEIPAETYASWVQSLHDQLAVAAGQATDGFGASVVDGLEEDESVIWEEAEDVGEGVVSNTRKGASATDLRKIGAWSMEGFALGILDKRIRVKNAVKSVSDDAKKEIKDDFDIGSPSKLMAEYGGYVAEGFAIGLEDGARSVTRAANTMFSAVNAAPVYGSAGTAGVANVSREIVDALSGAVVVIDGERAGHLLFPYINNEMGASMQRRYG